MESLDADAPLAAPEQDSPARSSGRAKLATAAPTAATRVALGAAGVGLVVGFFLPWFNLGTLMSVSGFGLVVSSGAAVEGLSGPHRALLFVVPFSGLALLATAVRGPRVATWVALASGVFILAYGLYTLLRLFFDATGAGMWLVVGSALLALGVGIANNEIVVRCDR